MTTFYGGSGNDSNAGSAGNDLLYGNGGNDTLSGGSGNDTMSGGMGNDSLDGGGGDDTLVGGQGKDSLLGGAGNDSIIGDGQWLSPSDYPSSLIGLPCTLHVVNASDGPISLYAIDIFGAISLVSDIAAGVTFNYLTMSGFNFLLKGPQGYYLDVIEGGNQTFTYAALQGDLIYGGDGNDTIIGQFGNETIYGDADNDSLDGGTGNDLIYGGTGNDTLLGDVGNDALYGDAGNDLIDGGTGHDLIEGGLGADSLLGGSGNDTINAGAGADTIFGGSGDDNIHGYWFMTSPTYQDGNDLIYGEAGNDAIAGDEGDDTVYGGADNDALWGWFGEDQLYGDAGDDQLYGEDDNDRLYGGLGNDSLDAGSGNDSAYGGVGNDSVTLGDGNDVFGDWGIDESGDDTIYGGLGNDAIIAGAGNDAVYGDAGDDALSGQMGNDTLYGGAGADVFVLSDDHEGDTIFGGETGTDRDQLSFGSYLSGQGVAVSFTGDEAGTYGFVGSSGAGVFSQIEVISGTAYNDTIDASAATSAQEIHGNAGSDSITGGSGNDTIYFGAGDDTAYGGAGDDVIDDSSGLQQSGSNLVYGGAGNDTIWLGQGSDTVYGGSGNDLILSEDSTALIYGGEGNDSLHGEDGADTIFGDDGADAIYGGAGNDLLYGGLGNDVLITQTGGGDDTIWGGEDPGGADRDLLWIENTDNLLITFTGDESGTMLDLGVSGGTTSFFEIEDIWSGDGNDTIDASLTTSGHSIAGSLGNDSLIGGSGNDTLDGEAGNDTLIGGAGRDVLTGGDGRDVFGFLDGSGIDTVSDFEMTLIGGVTTDRLDVSDLQNPDGSPVKAWQVVVSDDGDGQALLSFPSGEQLLLQGVSPASVLQPGQLNAMGVPCFARGSRILTPQGPRRVEKLRPGDLVTTTAGPMPVLWHGQRHLSLAELAAAPHLRPVRLPALAGQRVLKLSPQHGVYLAGLEGLARAAHLVEFGAATVLGPGSGPVEYHHLLLPCHALLRVEGHLCESFYPGRMALSGLQPLDLVAVTQAVLALAGRGPVAVAAGGAVALAALYGPRVAPLLSRRRLRGLLLPPEAGAAALLQSRITLASDRSPAPELRLRRGFPAQQSFG